MRFRPLNKCILERKHVKACARLLQLRGAKVIENPDLED